MIIVQGNSLENSRVVSPYYARNGVLAALTDESDIIYLKTTIKEQYPVIHDVINCESRWDNSRIGEAGEIGIAQYMPKTFKWFSDISGIKGDINNPQDQITLMVWAFQNGYAGHWTCYRIKDTY